MDGYRLSPRQKRGWLLQRADPGGHYLAHAVAEIGGVPEPALLRSAVDGVCRRHEVLRTLLESPPGVDVPLQVIHDDLAPAFAYHDAGDDPDGAWRALRARRAATGINLHHGPILHADLVKVSGSRSRLLLTLPAVSADTATLHHLVREIHDAYAAGGTGGLDDDVLQYADVAEWQHDLLTADETVAGRAFWQERSAPDADALPVDLGWAVVGSFRPAEVPIRLDPDALEAARALARPDDVPLWTVFATAWQAVVRRIANGAVAMALAGENRGHAELAHAFGPFAQWLPHACELDLSSPFTTALTDAARRSREMLRQQEFLDPAHAGSAPIARMAFSWTVSQPDHGWAVTHAVSHAEPFAVLLVGSEVGDSVRVSMHYDTSCLRAQDVQRLQDMYVCLLTAALHDPARRLADLPLADAAERERALAASKPAPSGMATPTCVHRAFEQRVARLPHEPAVVAGDTRLSGAELNARANRIARRLRGLGVGVETPVGLLVERSADLIAALFGIMKAGGAYVPLDPALPTERAEFMLAQARARIVVADRHLRGGLPDDLATLDPRDPGLAEEPGGNLAGGATPDNLAYVMFTSGSTGRPKGVAVTHANLLGYLRGISAVLDLPDGAGYATVSTFAADLGHTAVFPALCAGGVLHVIPQDLANDPDAFAGYRTRHEIDCLKIVPAHLRVLLDAARPEAVLPARWLVLGGEALPPDLARRVSDLAPHCRVLNHYGPTEITVGALSHLVDAGAGDAAIPLGSPLAHARAHVLDDHLRATAMWEPGEIYLGGAGVARGYAGQPALTAERFVPDPFGTEPGARLYRTGDRARRLADGSVLFFGRTDQQVKLRGYRVEPGEVEAVLRDRPGVTDAAVVAREDQPGAVRLVAYVVAPGATTSALHDHCAGRLPEYMVPAAIVLLDRLPLTPNGKLDRAALPAPAVDDPVPYAPPCTGEEETLARIWAEVLGLERVGRDDDFFALGGDSILSIQVVARAAKAGLTLTPPQLFQHPTIASLVPALGTTATAAAEQGVVIGPVPPTPIQRWFLDQDLPAPQHYNQTLLVEPLAALDTAALETALRALVSHHDALRLRLRDGKLDNAGPLDPTHPVLTLADITGTPADHRAAAIEDIGTRAQTGLDLGSGCLLRAVHIRLTDTSERLLLVAHHLGVDGVSWRILLEDLATAYRRTAEHRSIALPPKTTSYRAWAHHLAEHANSAVPEIPQWTSLLTGPGRTVPRDGDADVAVNTHGDAETVTVLLSPERSRILLRAKESTEHILLTALGRTLRAWTGQPRVVVDLEGHGREPFSDGVDLSRTAGWFTTIHPVALPPAGIRRTVHNGLHYGLLRYASTNPAAERLRALPAPEVRFNYLGHVPESGPGELFRLLPDSAGPAADPRARRPYVLDVTAVVLDGRLRIGWTYGPALHRRETIQTLADQLLHELDALLAAPHAADSGFAEAELSEQELEGLMDELDLLAAEGEA
jgi:amino acid adenylation domain-containing protein/non-ribosomal peptide synthase protein (TIGR01720 family)